MNDYREKTLKQMNTLRGLFALEIIIGHVVRMQSGILYPLGKFMICSVAFFFFVSAYGMVLSYQKKDDYLKPVFLKNKVLYLFLVTLAVYILYNLIDLVILKYDLGYFRNVLSIRAVFENTNWYLWQQMLFYIVFYVVYKYIKRRRIAGICIITVALSVVYYLIGANEEWYASLFAFALGVLFAEKFDQMKKFLESIPGVIIIIVLAAFGCASLVIHSENIVSMVFMRNAICLASVMIVFFISRIEFIGGNPVSKWLTRYSLELYVSQFIWLALIDSMELNYWVRIAVVLVCTIVMAIIIHYPFKLIKKITR